MNKLKKLMNSELLAQYEVAVSYSGSFVVMKLWTLGSGCDMYMMGVNYGCGPVEVIVMTGPYWMYVVR